MKENTQNRERSSRRSFLKKSLYTAPTIIALGSLAKPQNLQAGSTIPGNPDRGGSSGSSSGDGLTGNGLG